MINIMEFSSVPQIYIYFSHIKYIEIRCLLKYENIFLNEMFGQKIYLSLKQTLDMYSRKAFPQIFSLNFVFCNLIEFFEIKID